MGEIRPAAVSVNYNEATFAGSLFLRAKGASSVLPSEQSLSLPRNLLSLHPSSGFSSSISPAAGRPPSSSPYSLIDEGAWASDYEDSDETLAENHLRLNGSNRALFDEEINGSAVRRADRRLFSRGEEKAPLLERLSLHGYHGASALQVGGSSEKEDKQSSEAESEAEEEKPDEDDKASEAGKSTEESDESSAGEDQKEGASQESEQGQAGEQSEAAAENSSRDDSSSPQAKTEGGSPTNESYTENQDNEEESSETKASKSNNEEAEQGTQAEAEDSSSEASASSSERPHARATAGVQEVTAAVPSDDKDEAEPSSSQQANTVTGAAEDAKDEESPTNKTAATTEEPEDQSSPVADSGTGASEGQAQAVKRSDIEQVDLAAEAPDSRGATPSAGKSQVQELHAGEAAIKAHDGGTPDSTSSQGKNETAASTKGTEEREQSSSPAQIGATESHDQGDSTRGSTTPVEESHLEGTEGIAASTGQTAEAKVDMQQGKCYTEIALEALKEENELIKKAAENVHFQDADQGFCDEVFRRIDGPYSLAELTALLRAADVANSRSRNFRYCRATATSSPPRVRDGDSILHAAIAARKPHVTEVLLQFGAFPDIPSIPQNQRTTDATLSPLSALNTYEATNGRPLHAAASIQSLDSIESVELLMQYGAKVDTRDTLERTPLMLAAYHPKALSSGFVKRLLLAGADAKATDKAGMTALHYAAAGDNWPVVRILLDHGADPSAPDVQGNTPLHYAAIFNAYTSTTRLLETAEIGVHINAPNARGKAPIHLAAAPVLYQAVPRSIVPALALEALLLHHANPMARDKEGNTPLHLAATGGYVEIMRRLVDMASVPAEEKNAEGLTPLAAVQKSGKGPSTDEIVHFLKVYSENKSCIEPPLVLHSTRIFSDTVLGPYMRVGDTVTYACNPGFSMYGHHTVMCQERDGKMEFVPTPPLCVTSKEPSAASLCGTAASVVAVKLLQDGRTALET
ncbi:ankyrin repeat and KH domain-containing protein mask [Cyclospora cayetanensis]|uniref:Ankyrin repeat and KH domain-containing protein mask n=1 Tax=Cyclospora cayetanensis TaxID=88456 RepID=A0A6P6S2K4_9EIME|nr:ankyrin repeat and KH domain-containing protein mask [Cyclospora cayetanensis]